MVNRGRFHYTVSVQPTGTYVLMVSSYMTILLLIVFLFLDVDMGDNSRENIAVLMHKLVGESCIGDNRTCKCVYVK